MGSSFASDRASKGLRERSASQQNPPGEVVTRHLEGSIVETCYRGHCGVGLVESVARETPEILDAVPGTCWLLDMTGVKGVDFACTPHGNTIFRLFRARGGRAFALLLRGGPVGMMVSAAAFAAGLPLKVFERRDEALAYLRAQQAAAAVANPAP